MEFSLSDDCEMFKLDEDILSNIKPFSCGDEDLDDFFINEAIAYEKELMGKTYCWLLKEDNTKCVGMVTLANAGIQTTHMQNNSRRKSIVESLLQHVVAPIQPFGLAGLESILIFKAHIIKLENKLWTSSRHSLTELTIKRGADFYWSMLLTMIMH